MKAENGKLLKHRMVIYDTTNGDIYSVTTPQNAFVSTLLIKCSFAAGVRGTTEEMKNVPQEITLNEENIEKFEIITYANLAVTDPHVRAALSFLNVQMQALLQMAR